MKKERTVMDTQTGKSNNHYVVSSTIQVIENRTIVWVYQDNAKDRLLKGGDGESIWIHIECSSVTYNNGRFILHVPVMENPSQNKNNNSNGRNYIYTIIKCIKWLLKLAGMVIIKQMLN